MTLTLTLSWSCFQKESKSIIIITLLNSVNCKPTMWASWKLCPRSETQLCSNRHPALLWLRTPAVDSLGWLPVADPPRAPLPSAFHLSHQLLKNLPRALRTAGNFSHATNTRCSSAHYLETRPEPGPPDPWNYFRYYPLYHFKVWNAHAVISWIMIV